MKVIDLLNKIANGEEVPKVIKYGIYGEENSIFTYYEEEKEYYNDGAGYLSVSNSYLNDEVEIIETENEKLLKQLRKENQAILKLHRAIYDYIGEPYKYENGKITPISQIEENKEIKELNITEIRKREDCYPVTVEIMSKINELIKEVNKLKNK